MRKQLTLLAWLSIGTWRSHGFRLALSALSIAIGVAVALAIHLVNASALQQFSGALSQIHGESQYILKARSGALPDQAWLALREHPAVESLNPVIEIKLPNLKLLGVDWFALGQLNPKLLPQHGLAAMFEPKSIYLSQRALQSLQVKPGDEVRLGSLSFKVAGQLPALAQDEALALTDLANLQDDASPWLGKLSHIDFRLRAQASASKFLADMAQTHPDWYVSEPSQSLAKQSNVSRAYRVNLNVLAAVALISAGFMVYATMALNVRRQAKQQSLLGVLGAQASLSAQLVFGQALIIGLVGSVLGLLAGSLLAHIVLNLVGGDLGGGYFAGSKPALALDPWALVLFAAIGCAVSLIASAFPAFQLSKIQPARALRGGLDQVSKSLAPTHNARSVRLILALCALAWGLSQLPAFKGISLAAYMAIGIILIIGIAAVPLWIDSISHLIARSDFHLSKQAPLWLASQRLKRQPGSAHAAVAGVVASLALASAMAIMVNSFRGSVEQWLGTVFPADLYLRAETGASRGTALQARVNDELLQQLSQQSERLGIERIQALRAKEWVLDPQRAAIALVARPLSFNSIAKQAPIIAVVEQQRSDAIPLYVSEAMVDLYGWRLDELRQLQIPGSKSVASFHIAGIWRDYARQGGSLLIDLNHYRALTQDFAIDDLLIWLKPGFLAQVQGGLVSAQVGSGFAVRSTQEIRQVSMQIFDRSFALTYVLEAIAVLGALFGVASTYSGEALARAKEFGMLQHLGMDRKAIRTMVGVETGFMLLLACAWAVMLSFAMAWVLIHRVNPQSFHWTMDTKIPWTWLAMSVLLVSALGTLTALLATVSATGKGPVLAVREDW